MAAASNEPSVDVLEFATDKLANFRVFLRMHLPSAGFLLSYLSWLDAPSLLTLVYTHAVPHEALIKARDQAALHELVPLGWRNAGVYADAQRLPEQIRDRLWRYLDCFVYCAKLLFAASKPE